jgi:hypothetical protein
MDLLEKANQKRATGIWNDFVDGILRDWEYWRLVQNEELETEDGGGSAECIDACCFEYKACLTRASSSYIDKFLTHFFELTATGGTFGAAAGSVVPVVGTCYGAIGGGVIGGLTGLTQSIRIHLLEKQACVYTYKACIIRKNEK